jgi:hypothetical protein
MLELSPVRKNKVNLADYNSGQDINNRIMLSDFTSFEHKVLEEILFSPLKFPFKKLCRSLESSEADLIPVLEKLQKAGLISIEGETIFIDKEMRKYFEFQITRFDPDFKPDMDFLQNLLKKVPIHTLPSWYSIPRTSNNIFESILEKHFLSPQIFIRYLGELHLGNPIINGIIEDLYSSPNFQLSSSDLISKYNLSRHDFEEIMLLLEFNFVGCLFYVKEDDHWIESVSPFYEWREYLLFLQQSTSPCIEPPEKNPCKKAEDFCFIEDMSALLIAAKQKQLALPGWKRATLLSPLAAQGIATLVPLSLHSLEGVTTTQTHLTRLIEKLCALKLADVVDGHLYITDAAKEWLDLSLENKALYLYRHPLNQMHFTNLSMERHVHEAEKAVKRVLHGKWVYFDDFIKGVIVPLDEDSIVSLKKTGKTWRYTIPQYTEEQKKFIKTTIFERLFETGMVSIGTLNDRDCFRTTKFGRFFFET